MKHWRKGLKRITAVALAVMMIGTTVDASALAVLAAEEVAEVTCNHVCDEACGGMQAATEGALTTCTHVHDEECGYEEETEDAVCTCETDDPAFHATNCPAYIAPENPECLCAEKCTEVNIWCDVCGVDYTQCGGTDTAAAYDNAETYNLWVGGVQITSDNLLIDSTDDSTISGMATYDPDTNTLTLDNFNYTGPGYTNIPAAICYTGTDALNLTLEGNSTVTQDAPVTGGRVGSYGVYVDVGSGLIVSGNGSLTAVGGTDDDFYDSEVMYYGVFVASYIAVESGTLTGTGGNVSTSDVGLSCGVYAVGDITVKGGTLTGTGGSVSTSSHATSYGVLASGSRIVVESGTLTGTSGTVSGTGITESYGVGAGESITLSGGVTVAQGDTQAFNELPVTTSFANAVVWHGESDDAYTDAGTLINNAGTYYTNKYVRIAPCDHGGETPTYENGNCTVCGTRCNHTDNTNTEYTNDLNGSTHSLLCSVCSLTLETADHTVAPTYTRNTYDSTKHNVTYSCCGTFTEVHSGGSYSVSGAVITDSCTKCGTELGTATISATGKNYDGTAFEATVTKTGTFESQTITVAYAVKDGAALESAPVNAGTYTASITLGEGENAVTATVEFEIKKADLDLGTVTAETLKDTLNTSDVKLSPDNNTVEGTLALAEDTVLKYGTNTYNWVFTPEDTTNYNQATGTVEITINDTIAPEISGVENGKVYCEAQTITVTDANTLTVTINDTPVELTNGTYELAATGAQYVIVATDGMNSTTVTVTVGHVDANSDGKCDVCVSYVDGIGARLMGYSISMDGNIGVNFYMELEKSVLENKDAYMQFTLDGKDYQQVPVSEAEKKEVDGETYYVFKCGIPAKDMKKTITARIILNEATQGTVYSFTVGEYADYILDENNNYDEATKAVVTAMMTYGDYAAAYFGEEELAATEEINQVTADTLARFAATVTNGSEENEASYYGSSLLLRSQVVLRHYFTKAVDGATQSGDYWYLDIVNIPAHKLHENIVTEVEGITISYSPLSYAYTVLNGGSKDESLKNLVKAMYLYNHAARIYAGETCTITWDETNSAFIKNISVTVDGVTLNLSEAGAVNVKYNSVISVSVEPEDGYSLQTAYCYINGIGAESYWNSCDNRLREDIVITAIAEKVN